MPSLDPALATKAVAGVLMRPEVLRWMCARSWRAWYWLRPARALHDFRSLAPLVEGLQAQEAEGDVNSAALAALATALESLPVFPPAVGRRHARSALAKELSYLATCMGFHASEGHLRSGSEDYLSLPLARKRFAKGAALTDPDWTRDALTAGWDRYINDRTGGTEP